MHYRTGHIELDTNTARIRRVDRPQDEPILVALERLRRCPDEVPDEFWPPTKSTTQQSKKDSVSRDSHQSKPVRSPMQEGSQPTFPGQASVDVAPTPERNSDTPTVSVPVALPTKKPVPSTNPWAHRLRRQPGMSAA